jgi:hypothetical protein
MDSEYGAAAEEEEEAFEIGGRLQASGERDEYNREAAHAFWGAPPEPLLSTPPGDGTATAVERGNDADYDDGDGDDDDDDDDDAAAASRAAVRARRMAANPHLKRSGSPASVSASASASASAISSSASSLRSSWQQQQQQQQQQQRSDHVWSTQWSLDHPPPGDDVTADMVEEKQDHHHQHHHHHQQQQQQQQEEQEEQARMQHVVRTPSAAVDCRPSSLSSLADPSPVQPVQRLDVSGSAPAAHSASASPSFLMGSERQVQLSERRLSTDFGGGGDGGGGGGGCVGGMEQDSSSWLQGCHSLERLELQGIELGDQDALCLAHELSQVRSAPPLSRCGCLPLVARQLKTPID